jgi:hypothetical protein
MVSMAALGSYFIVSLRLIRRVNNFDVQPILFYFLSYHVLLAVIVAGIVRHFFAFSEIEQATDPRFLAVMGFGIGLQPDIFLLSLNLHKIRSTPLQPTKVHQRWSSNRPIFLW